jgi:hypothetical protein
MWIGGFCGATRRLTYGSGEPGVRGEASRLRSAASTHGLMAATLQCPFLMDVDVVTSQPVCSGCERIGSTNGGGRTIHDGPTSGGRPNSGHRASR